MRVQLIRDGSLVGTALVVIDDGILPVILLCQSLTMSNATRVFVHREGDVYDEVTRVQFVAIDQPGA